MSHPVSPITIPRPAKESPLLTTVVPQSKFKRERELAKEMEPHWRAPEPNWFLLRWLIKIHFASLCLIVIGQPTLARLWAAVELEEREDDDSLWESLTDRMLGRLNTMIVVSSLMFAACAAFLTTVPPDKSLIDYTQPSPYLCLLGAFACFITAVVIASGMQLFIGGADPESVKKVIMSSRFNVYANLFMASVPLVSITCGILLLGLAQLVAAWVDPRPGMIAYGSLAWMCIPGGIAILFFLTIFAGKGKNMIRRKENASNAGGSVVGETGDNEKDGILP